MIKQLTLKWMIYLMEVVWSNLQNIHMELEPLPFYTKTDHYYYCKGVTIDGDQILEDPE